MKVSVMCRNLLFSAVFFLAAGLAAGEVVVKNPVIVLKGNQAALKGTANSLKKHIELVTGTKIGKKTADSYRFILELDPKQTKEGTWKTTEKETVFKGSARTIRYAVNEFLEKQLKIVWMDWDNTVAPHQNPIRLQTGDGVFKDRYQEHYLWARGAARLEWISNMSCDKFINWNTIHAFGTWWEKYGKQHPEFFTLNQFGVRGRRGSKAPADNETAPKDSAGRIEDIDICCSNKDLPDFVIARHLESKLANREVNISSNDHGDCFCRCAACRALDTKPDPKWKLPPEMEDYKTDRYVYFANKVAKKAATLNPPRDVHFLSYCFSEYPPRREKLEPNIRLTYCPQSDYRIETLHLQLGGWIKAGAKRVRVRPNMPCFLNSWLPLGYEKQAYDYYKAALSYPEVVGCNIDNLNTAPRCTFGFAYYVMGKVIIHPELTFEEIERQYLTGYGSAAPEMQKYFAYWRNIWKTKMLPDYDNMLLRARYGNIARAVLMAPARYYTVRDFDATDAILKAALRKKLLPEERKRIEEMVQVNYHARLIFHAATEKGDARTIAVRNLLKFRKAHPVFCGFSMKELTAREIRWGDLTGMNHAEATEKYDLPVIATPNFWYFKIDPKEVGEKEKWYDLQFADFSRWGEQACMYTYWQGTPKMPLMSRKLKQTLAKYDGIGWYANRLKVPKDWKNRKVYLLIGAVDESCKIWVNGKLVHVRKYKNPGDEAKSFDVDITSAIEWDFPEETDVVIQVEDRNGEGGIYRKIFLVSKKTK